MIYTIYMREICNRIGGIKVRDWKGLRAYLATALRRCGCELDQDRKDEVELFLIERYWLKCKPIPTKIVIRGRKIEDPAVRWALRTKLRDASFQNHTISSLINEKNEEVDIFEIVGKEDDRYTEIEQWISVCQKIGFGSARVLLFSLYNAEFKQEEKQENEWKQKALF